MYGFVITTLGQNLIAKLVAGDQMTITRIMVGDGTVAANANLLAMTDLVSPFAEATSTNPIVTNGQVDFIVEYRNDLDGGLATNRNLNEFGVFAQDPDVGEILLYYGTLGDRPQPVSAFDGNFIEVRRFLVSIALSADVNVVLNFPAGAFLTAEMLLDHLKDPQAHENRRGVANGFAPLDENSLVPLIHLPEIDTNDPRIPNPTAPNQMLISDVNDPTDPRFQLINVDAQARPVRNFMMHDDTSEVPAKTAPPFPGDLIAYIDFDNGSLTPRVGNFTLTSAGTDVVPGFFGQARQGRAGAHLQASQRLIPTGAVAHSIRFKLKLPSDLWRHQAVIMSEHRGITGSNHGIRIRKTAMTNVIEYERHMGGATATFAVTSPVLEPERWYDVLCTWTGTTATNGVRMWVDGELVGQATSSALQAPLPEGEANTTFFNMPAPASGIPSISWFNGTLDEIEIYNTVRTPASFPSNILGGIRLAWDNPDTFVRQSTVIQSGATSFPADITQGNRVVETFSNSHFVEGASFDGPWSRTVPPFPADLVAFIPFTNSSLVPSVGSFTITNTGTTAATGYWNDANGARHSTGGTTGLQCSQRIIPGTGPYSIRFKIRWASGSNTHVMHETSGTTPVAGFRMLTGAAANAGRLTFNHFATDLSRFTTDTGAGRLDDNEWHEVLFTWTGNNAANGVNVWVDGELRSRLTATGNSTAGNINTTFFNGAGVGNNNAHNIILDEIEVYNTVRTPDSFPRDAVGLSNFLTAFGRNTTSASEGRNVNQIYAPPVGEFVTGTFSGVGDINIGFTPRTVLLSAINSTNLGLRSAPAINVNVNVETTVDLSHSNQTGIDGIRIRGTEAGFNIVAIGSSITIRPIHYIAWR